MPRGGARIEAPARRPGLALPLPSVPAQVHLDADEARPLRPAPPSARGTSDGEATTRLTVDAAGVTAAASLGREHCAAPYAAHRRGRLCRPRRRSSTLRGRSFPSSWRSLVASGRLDRGVVHAGLGGRRRRGGLLRRPRARRVALVTVLPEFIIEVRFAFIQQAELVTANLTGRDAAAARPARPRCPLLVAFIARRRAASGRAVRARADPPAGARDPAGHVDLRDPDRRPRSPDGLRRRRPPRALRPLRATRAGHAGRGARRRRRASRPPARCRSRYRRPAIAALIVVAAVVVVMIANPFADALLATGTSLGHRPRTS